MELLSIKKNKECHKAVNGYILGDIIGQSTIKISNKRGI